MLKPLSLALALLGAFFIGCTTGTSPHVSLSTIGRIYVAETVGANTAETSASSAAVHDAAVSELRRLGYTVAASSTEADAILRSSWRIKKSEDNRNDAQVASLSVSLFDKKNHRLFDADSGPYVPTAFWNESRAGSEVAGMLNRLGRSTASQK
jgi:hypothetical protein